MSVEKITTVAFRRCETGTYLGMYSVMRNGVASLKFYPMIIMEEDKEKICLAVLISKDNEEEDEIHETFDYDIKYQVSEGLGIHFTKYTTETKDTPLSGDFVIMSIIDQGGN